MKVNVKRLGKRKNSIEVIDMQLAKSPSTIRDLIEETVKFCVNRFLENCSNQEVLKALSLQEIHDKASTGKITFGVLNGEVQPKEDEAIKSALEAFLDGIVVIFIDGIQQQKLSDPVEINDATEVTFVRLTMLTGRLW